MATYEKILIGLLVVTMFVTASVIFMSGMTESYPNATLTNLEKDIQKISVGSNATNTTNKLQSLITNSTVQETSLFGFLVTGIWNTMNLAAKSLSFVNDLMHYTSIIIGIPKWAVDIIASIVILVGVFIFIRAAIRWQQV